MEFCKNCGNKIIEGVEFCTECGAKITVINDNEYSRTMSEKKCPQCGEQMPEDMFYCLNCGYRFWDKEEELSDVIHRVQRLQGTWKNKWITLVLCVFLGFFGIHKFYEEKIFAGIIYLFTFGLFGIGWIVDIIRLAFKPNPYRVR